MRNKDLLKLRKDVNHGIRLCNKYIKVLKSKHCDRLLRLEYQNLASMLLYLHDLKYKSNKKNKKNKKVNKL